MLAGTPILVTLFAARPMLGRGVGRSFVSGPRPSTLLHGVHEDGRNRRAAAHAGRYHAVTDRPRSAFADGLAEPRAAAARRASYGSHRGRARGFESHDPMPGGFLGGWWGDTGIDIAGDHLDVYALAGGTLDYAEWGHTRWMRKPDTAFSVRLRFDEPIVWDDGHRVTHAYYTHLSKVENEVKEGAAMRKHVVAGERIGVSGIGNGTPHLHLGLLLDDQVEQDSWTYILREDAIRKLMGRIRNGARLPLAHRPR